LFFLSRVYEQTDLFKWSSDFFYCLCFCDRSLTIGQMQGKFQMIVVRHTGHAIQEDVPDEFATLVINFISRNQIGPNGVVVCIFFISYQCCFYCINTIITHTGPYAIYIWVYLVDIIFDKIILQIPGLRKPAFSKPWIRCR
jgi:hypothetical protein